MREMAEKRLKDLRCVDLSQKQCKSCVFHTLVYDCCTITGEFTNIACNLHSPLFSRTKFTKEERKQLIEIELLEELKNKENEQRQPKQLSLF